MPVKVIKTSQVVLTDDYDDKLIITPDKDEDNMYNILYGDELLMTIPKKDLNSFVQKVASTFK